MQALHQAAAPLCCCCCTPLCCAGLVLVLFCVQAASLGGTPESSPVCGRVLPAVTVEEMEAFFNKQLRQVCWGQMGSGHRSGMEWNVGK